MCVCLCVASGERRGVRGLPRGTVRLSDRGAHQTESQTADQSHQGEGVQAEGETDPSVARLIKSLSSVMFYLPL